MNDEYYEELLRELVNSQRNCNSNIACCKKYSSLKQWIYDKTQYLFNNDDFYTLGTRIFYILNDIHELPQCANPNCSNILKINFRNCDNKEEFYKHCCCVRCVQFNPIVKDKIEKTTLERYGYRRGNVKQDTQKKKEDTMLKRYGHKYSMQCPELRNKLFNNNLKKFGSISPFGSIEIKNKIKEHNIEKYNVEYPLQSNIIQNKAKSTLFKNYGVNSPFESEKIIGVANQTRELRYGSTSYLGTLDCLEKTKKFCNDHYGVDYILQIPEVREKSKQTNIEKYGHEIAYAFGTDEHNELIKLKYGVEHISQNPDIRKKQQHRYTYRSISFDSAPEIAFYIWLTDVKDILDIDFEYSPNVKFEYFHNGKKHYYMPDFRLGDQYIEIKGDHFFKNGKMILPFRRKEWSDELYQDLCNLYEAKHQCMLKNNVIIFRNNEYQFFVDYVYEKYGNNYLKQFKK